MLIRRFALVSTASLVIGLFAVAGVVRAEDSLWQTDFAAAKAKAKAENKLMLVDFTGSNWCPPCMKLAADVLHQDAFKAEATKQFVLVELDFPRGKKLEQQSDALKKQNQGLLAKYKIQFYPSVLVMDAEGKVIAKTGYQSGGPEKYLKHLAKFVEVYGDVVKLTKELGAAKGLDRAKILDKLIDDYIALGNEVDDIPAWDKEIVKLDADNKAGLRVKHEYRVLMVEFSELRENQSVAEAKAVADKMLALKGISSEQQLDVYLGLSQLYRGSKQFDEAGAAADKALAVPGITGEQKQAAYMAKCECAYVQGDFVTVVACLKKGIAAAPDSEGAKQFKEIIEKFQPMAEAQQALGKLKAQLESAKGLDRAKLLDKLIEAWEKVGGRSRDISAQQIDKWSREIVVLDADGKGGLKTKHEFRNLMNDAKKLWGKPVEFRAAVEKAIALPGLTGEQIQSGHVALARSYMEARDAINGLAQLQKAVDAAPNTPLGKSLKKTIADIKQQMDAAKPKAE